MANISTPARDASGEAILAILNSGSILPTPYIEIRTGPIPATPQIPATGEVLATLQMSLPAFGSVTNGTAVANEISIADDIETSCVASYIRLYNFNNTQVIDCTITPFGGGGDIEFDNVTFLRGGSVQIINLELIVPQ